MESAGWPSSHCEALKEFVTRGMSYRDAAKALNARFGTAYSRDAALGRARRMGLGELARPGPPPSRAEERVLRPTERLRSADDFRPLTSFPRRPVFEPVERVPLRCVEVVPRHLALIELRRGDCRFPYGGDLDGQAITFCGRPRRKGASYCTPHFHLTREPVVPAARLVSATPLRLVDAV